MRLGRINTKLMSELLSACPPPLHDEEIPKYALSSFSLRNDRGVAVMQPSVIYNKGNRYKNHCEVTVNCDDICLRYSAMITTEKKTVLLFFIL